MHFIQRFSISILIALAGLVICRPSLATTLPLDVTTLKGITQIGSVTTTGDGKDVRVTIKLDSGYLLKADDGYVMFDTTGGLKLTNKSLSGFNVSKISDNLSHVTTIGGFTFTDVFRIDTDGSHPKVKPSSSGKRHDNDGKSADSDDHHDKGKTAKHHDSDEKDQILLSDLTFMILNAKVNQLTGFGVQFCVADKNGCGKTGFAETSVSTAPEPGTLALLGTGLVGLATVFRRRSSARKSKS